MCVCVCVCVFGGGEGGRRSRVEGTGFSKGREGGGTRYHSTLTSRMAYSELPSGSPSNSRVPLRCVVMKDRDRKV